jgi:hypothetical protein
MLKPGLSFRSWPRQPVAMGSDQAKQRLRLRSELAGSVKDNEIARCAAGAGFKKAKRASIAWACG